MLARGRFGLGVIVLAGVLLPSSAQSQQLPAAVCYPSGPGTAGYTWTGIANESTSGVLYLDCSPNPNSLGNYIRVAYVDQTPGNITCNSKLIGRDSNNYYGLIVWSGSAQTSSANDSVLRVFDWDPSDSIVGTAYVSCTLPVMSGSSVSRLTSVAAI